MTWGRQLVFTLLALASARLGADGYSLKKEAALNGPWARVSDLLEPRPQGKLGEVKVRRLGPPGSTLQVGRDLVLVRIREAKLGALPQVTGSSCLVTSSQRLVPAADITAFAERYLRDSQGGLSESALVEIKLTAPLRDIKVPDRAVRFEIKSRPGQALRGNVMLRVSLLQQTEEDGEMEVGTSLLNFLVRQKKAGLVASAKIARGEAISAANTVLELRDLTFEKEAAYASLEEAEGLAAKAPIMAGKLVLPSMLARPAVVKRGDILRLTVRSGLIAVEVQAKALRDAAAGDSIPMEVLSTKKQIQAVVQDARTALSE